MSSREQEALDLVREIAYGDPWTHEPGDFFNFERCRYCGAGKLIGGETEPHSEECVWLRAAKIAEEHQNPACDRANKLGVKR